MLYTFDTIQGNRILENSFAADLESFTESQQDKLLSGEEIPDTIHNNNTYCALSLEQRC